MYMSFDTPKAVSAFGFAPRPVAPRQPTLRETHAHLLAVAAARRLRAVERHNAHRDEDADYWKAVAPAALAKAAALRAEPDFNRLPN